MAELILHFAESHRVVAQSHGAQPLGGEQPGVQYFVGQSSGLQSPQLIGVTFWHKLLTEVRHVERGKGLYSTDNCGSFQWTAGVKAVALFFVKAARVVKAKESLAEPILKGKSGSPAASLDYAICRTPNWLLDMFGVDSRGTSLLRRVISIRNSNCKLPGPVVLFLNSLQRENTIKVVIEGQEITEASKLLELERHLYSAWPNAWPKACSSQGREVSIVSRREIKETVSISPELKEAA